MIVECFIKRTQKIQLKIGLIVILEEKLNKILSSTSELSVLLLIFISFRGVVIFFFSQVNYADFHRTGRMCFIPKLLNYSK